MSEISRRRQAPHPGRPRSANAHRAILQASLALMEEGGFGALTIEALSARAGVGKNTIYRRWKTPAAVLLEALATETAAHIALPDTGSVRGDVAALLKQAFRRLTTTRTGEIVRVLMAQAQFDDQVRRDMRRLFIDGRRLALSTVLERGRDRGEIAVSADISLLVDLIYGVMWYRLLAGHAPLDAALAGDLAGVVVAAGGPNSCGPGV